MPESLLISTVPTAEEDCRSFVGAPKLLGVIVDFLGAACCASLLNFCSGIYVLLSQCLNSRSLRAKRRGESRRFRFGGDRR